MSDTLVRQFENCMALGSVLSEQAAHLFQQMPWIPEKRQLLSMNLGAPAVDFSVPGELVVYADVDTFMVGLKTKQGTRELLVCERDLTDGGFDIKGGEYAGLMISR